MRPRLHLACAAALVGCLLAVSAYAQDVSDPAPAPAPANLSYIDGSVDVVLDGVTEPADPPQMLVEGDSVRTHNGRAEVVFRDGTVIHLSNDTTLEVLGDERLRLTEGRLIVRMSDAAARPYVIDAPASSVRLEAQGEYGLSTEPMGRLQLSVTRGAASIDGTPQWSLRGGQMLTLVGPGARPLIESFNSARFDAFALWAHDRVQGFTSSPSAAQLPYELRPYAPVLDSYGRWDYMVPYGYVWFPSVGAAWRPYYDGSWAFTRYGWTWHGRDRWAWPTHHYGRWRFNGALWYWIPANVWAPAWVTWSVASGYVSWAPLGWHVGGPLGVWRRGDHPAYTPHYNTWRGWTIVPRNHFAPRRSVRAHALDGDRLDDSTRQALLNHAVPSRTADDIAIRRESLTSPRPRGNVRSLPVAPPTRPDVAAAPGRRADDPAYVPPAAWRGADRPGGGRGGADRSDADRTDAARGGAARRGAERRRPDSSGATPAQGSSEGSSGPAGGRRGADRAPAARPAQPRTTPSGTPTARPPQSQRDSGGAVPRGGASRRKG
jgi:hypothetical protein